MTLSSISLNQASMVASGDIINNSSNTARYKPNAIRRYTGLNPNRTKIQPFDQLGIEAQCANKNSLELRNLMDELVVCQPELWADRSDDALDFVLKVGYGNAGLMNVLRNLSEELWTKECLQLLLKRTSWVVLSWKDRAGVWDNARDGFDVGDAGQAVGVDFAAGDLWDCAGFNEIVCVQDVEDAIVFAGEDVAGVWDDVACVCDIGKTGDRAGVEWDGNGRGAKRKSYSCVAHVDCLFVLIMRDLGEI